MTQIGSKWSQSRQITDTAPTWSRIDTEWTQNGNGMAMGGTWNRHKTDEEQMQNGQGTSQRGHKVILNI